MDKRLGGKIRQIRELKGFSQDYVAAQLGISQRAYSEQYEARIKALEEEVLFLRGLVK